MTEDSDFLALAMEQARIGYEEGGVPIGAVLAIAGEVIARGRNRRVQMASVIRHAEMDCLENAGRLPASAYAASTLYTSLSPCQMCTGAILHYGILRIVVGAGVDFALTREMLEKAGVDVVVMENQGCLDLMDRFILEQPNVWTEDIGTASAIQSANSGSPSPKLPSEVDPSS